MKIIFLILLTFVFAFSGERAGDIIEKEGKVNVQRKGEIRSRSVNHLPYPLFVGDRVITFWASRAVAELLGVGRVAILENSILYIEGIEKLGVDKGMVLFRIERKERVGDIKIKVKTIIVGVKGTSFLIKHTDDEILIYVKEGEVYVKNLERDFIRYKGEEDIGFWEFKMRVYTAIEEEKREYEKFKEKTEREFLEFVREFTLKEGMAVIIRDNLVMDVEFTEELERLFEIFEEI